MKIQVNDQDFILLYQDCRFDEIDVLIRPLQNLTYREFPYQITDKKNNVKYQVSRVEGGIQLRFTKEQLAFISIEDLIESLEIKLKQHLNFMAVFLRSLQHIPWAAIRFVEYAPTDLHIGMQFGNIVDCDFYISKIIGHSIMDKEAKFLHFSLFKVKFIKEQQSLHFYKVPPLNINLLTSLLEIGPFCSTFYHTFLPMQILQHVLVDISPYCSTMGLPTFLPNKEFGVFQFKHSQNQLAVQVVTKFVNNKLVIQLREAASFLSLMGYIKIDFHKYQEDFSNFVKSWEFEQAREIQDFFYKFVVVSASYMQFFDNIDSRLLVLRILKKISIEKYLTKVCQKMYQLLGIYHNIIQQHPKRESMQDQRKLYELASLISNRYLHIISMMVYEDTDPRLLIYLKIYFENMEKLIISLKNSQIQIEGKVSEYIERVKKISFEQSDNLFLIRISMGIEYRCSRTSVRKFINQEMQEWTYSNFQDDQLKLQMSTF